MANLRKCSCCKSEIDISFFGVNRKKEPYKTCDTCRSNKQKKRDALKRTDVDFVDGSANAMPDTPQVAEANNIQAPEELIEAHNNQETHAHSCEHYCMSDTEGEPSMQQDKYIIVMDVETNGLIHKRGLKPTKSNLNEFPRIVQFSWGLYTASGELKEMKDFIIKPDGWTMEASERYHGISLERATNEGKDIREVLEEYKNDIDNHCFKLVCHNAKFDTVVVKSELMRQGLAVNNVDTYCTMMETINYCKLVPKVRGEYKWASLEQLYRKLFKDELEHAHNSYYDVINTAIVFFFFFFRM